MTVAFAPLRFPIQMKEQDAIRFLTKTRLRATSSAQTDRGGGSEESLQLKLELERAKREQCESLLYRIYGHGEQRNLAPRKYKTN